MSDRDNLMLFGKMLGSMLLLMGIVLGLATWLLGDFEKTYESCMSGSMLTTGVPEYSMTPVLAHAGCKHLPKKGKPNADRK